MRFANEKRGKRARELKAVMASNHELSNLVQRALYAKRPAKQFQKYLRRQIEQRLFENALNDFWKLAQERICRACDVAEQGSAASLASPARWSY